MILIRDQNWRMFFFSLVVAVVGGLFVAIKTSGERFGILGGAMVVPCFVAYYYRKALLPHVNEKILLTHTIIVWYAFFALVYSPGWSYYLLAPVLAFLAMPTLATLWLAFTNRQLSFDFKLFFYSWYLMIVILVVLFQSSFNYALFFMGDAGMLTRTVFETALAGMVFCYMFLHVVYSFQMLPLKRKGETQDEADRRWHGWVDMMTGRYDDMAQLAPIHSLLLVLIVGGFLALNYHYKFISASTVINLGIVILPSLMSKRMQSPMISAGNHAR